MDLHQLMIEKLSGIISPEDERLLTQKMLEDKELRRQWEELQRTIPISGTLQYNLDESWEEISGRVQRSKKQRSKRLMFAAALLAGILIGGFVLIKPAHRQLVASKTADAPLSGGLHLQLAGGKVIDLSQAGATNAGDAQLANDTTTKTLSYTDKGADVSMNKLWVPPGLDYTLKLSDGSEIVINSATEIWFPFRFADAARTIRISGEAYCKIARDDARPFIVELPDGARVEVLGTTFNVNTYEPGRQKVSLVNGAVALKSVSKKVVLQPGQQGSYVAGQDEMTVHSFNPDELAWINGQYVLDNAPISELAALLTRWFNTPVQLDNADLAASRHFTGIVFKNRPIGEFLDILCATANCTYYYKERVLHIRLNTK
ncbi:FecR family protein [Chitinophaga sp.]|uniref:FecR family protein n=1 Tax=Chitinophaga sp. TaxID=1869181 RepID=UPI002F93C092